MSIFDFNRDGEVSSSEQAFGLGAILAALSETEAEVKITIKASTGGDEDYESMDRDELESLRERVCQDDFCKFSKFKYLSAEKTPNISCRHIS